MTPISEEERPLLFRPPPRGPHRVQLSEEHDHRTYKRRWYMLAVIAVLNLSNGMVDNRCCELPAESVINAALRIWRYEFLIFTKSAIARSLSLI